MLMWWGDCSRRARILVGFGLIGGVPMLAARELGFFDFSLSTGSTRGERNFTLGVGNESKERSLAVEFVEGERRSVRHLHRSNGEPLNVRVEIKRIEFDGLFWTPLLKCVSCSFEGQITSDDESVTGEIAGTIDRNVYGLYSARTLQQELRERVESYAFEPFKL